jgi:hypothetical protein
VPIHAAVLITVGKASTDFCGETNISSGSFGTMNGGNVSASLINEKQQGLKQQNKKTMALSIAW